MEGQLLRNQLQHVGWVQGDSRKRAEIEQWQPQLPFIFWNDRVPRAFSSPVNVPCPWRLPHQTGRERSPWSKGHPPSAQRWLLLKLSHGTLSWLLCSPACIISCRAIIVWTKELIPASIQIWAPTGPDSFSNTSPHAGGRHDNSYEIKGGEWEQPSRTS